MFHIHVCCTGELDAFIWDSSRLEYEAAQDCDLATATEQFGRSGYGIGLPKNSFWTQRVNQEVLAMHESGFMEELDNKWILQGDDNDYDNCPTRAERQKPATLGLSNMAGVFILVGVGIVGGIGLIMIEVIYKKSQVKQQRQLDVARSAAERWKRLVEVRPKSTQTSRTSLSVSGLQASQTEVKMPTPSRPRGTNGAGAGPSSGRHVAPQTGGNGNTIAKTSRTTISKGIEEVQDQKEILRTMRELQLVEKRVYVIVRLSITRFIPPIVSLLPLYILITRSICDHIHIYIKPINNFTYTWDAHDWSRHKHQYTVDQKCTLLPYHIYIIIIYNILDNNYILEQKDKERRIIPTDDTISTCW